MSVDIAFITVNFNTCRLVADLVDFFSRTELPFSYCLVVVDNASSDGSREMLERMQSDRLIYLQTNQNLGYGRGMNCGLASVASRYACIMNTDLVLNRDALVALWEFFEESPHAGVASPLILGANGRQQGFVFHSGILSLYSDTVCKVRSKIWKRRVAQADAPVAVPGVLGAFFMVRRSLFSDGLFDEDFFFYYEDTELAHRYWRNDIPCYVLPHVSITHLGGQSTSVSGGKLFQESRRMYIRKVYGDRHAAVLERLDRFRLYLKYVKYLLLAGICPTEKIRSKQRFYARLTDNSPLKAQSSDD